jgi:hypothetical protein
VYWYPGINSTDNSFKSGAGSYMCTQTNVREGCPGLGGAAFNASASVASTASASVASTASASVAGTAMSQSLATPSTLPSLR